MPYTNNARVGNYSLFLHPNYRDEVITRMHVQLDEGFDLSFSHPSNVG